MKPNAVGIQGHWLLESPDLAEIRAGIELFLAEGLPVETTQLDVDPLPRRSAPKPAFDAVMQTLRAKASAEAE
jgi:GH35 family endo-1,4-beta-xylanase